MAQDRELIVENAGRAQAPDHRGHAAGQVAVEPGLRRLGSSRTRPARRGVGRSGPPPQGAASPARPRGPLPARRAAPAGPPPISRWPCGAATRLHCALTAKPAGVTPSARACPGASRLAAPACLPRRRCRARRCRSWRSRPARAPGPRDRLHRRHLHGPQSEGALQRNVDNLKQIKDILDVIAIDL